MNTFPGQVYFVFSLFIDLHFSDTASIMVFVASRLDYIFAESTRYNSAPNTFTIYDVLDVRLFLHNSTSIQWNLDSLHPP